MQPFSVEARARERACHSAVTASIGRWARDKKRPEQIGKRGSWRNSSAKETSLSKSVFKKFKCNPLINQLQHSEISLTIPKEPTIPKIHRFGTQVYYLIPQATIFYPV
jgi:hypothetical protein